MSERPTSTTDVERLLEDAAAAVERGNWAEALRCAQAVLAVAPDHVEAAGVVALAERRAARAARESGDRRHMTVMFCDVVGSTEYATTLDPEEMLGLLRLFQQSAAEAVERYDGYVAQFMGDGFLAYFGYPRAHEDAPRRAILAGLDLVDAMRRHAPDAGRADHVHLNVRVGIHTGIVVLAGIGGDTPTARFGEAYGETLHIAARVQSTAVPSTVQITGDTAELVTGFFHLEPLGPQSLKGVERPIEVFRVSRPSGAETRLEAAVERTPLVGRADERSDLLDAWHRARDGVTEAILLRGDAGIGKSRLVESVSDALGTGSALVVLQCSPHHSATAFYPARRAIERLAGVMDVADVDERRRRLRAHLKGVGLDEPMGRLALSALSSTELSTDDPSPNVSPEQLREQIFQLIVAVLDAVAADATLLCVVEDLHWADASTLELLARVHARPAPRGRLILLTSRPGTDLALSPVEVIELGPLPDEDQVELVAALVGPTSVPSATVDAIIQRSDGVPLFVEELTRAMRRNVQLAQGHESVPPTLNDLLRARLDQYPIERPLAQMIATIGRPVSFDLLSTLADHTSDDLLRQLAVLEDGGILRAAGSPPAFEFSHALLRDAAYESQLLSRRREMHAVVASALESLAADEDVDLIAHHFQHAADHHNAARYWHRAGVRAMSIAALPEAIERFETASALIEHLADPPAQLHWEIQRDLAACLLQARGYTSPETEAASAKALKLSLEADDAGLVPTLYGLWAYYTIRADYDRGWDISEQSVRVAESQGDDSDLVAARAMAGYVQMMRGDFRSAAREMRSAADRLDDGLALRLPHSPPIAGLVHLATIELAMGYPDRAEDTLRRAFEATEQLDEGHIHFQRAYVNVFAAFHHCVAGDYERAVEHANTAVAISAEHGYASWFGAGSMNMLLATILSEPTPDGIETFLVGYGMSTDMGIRAFTPWYLAGLGEAYMRFGDLEAARRRCDEAIAFIAETREAFYQAEAYRIRGEVRTAAGEAAGRNDLVAAVSVAREQGARWFELRALTSLGRAGENVRDELRELLGSLDEGADRVEVRAAHQVLEGGSDE